MPQSWSYKKQAAMREAWHTQKPDVDNVAKAILDALKNRWRDDTQVARLTVDKRWTDCEQGHTWIEILELT
jgi:Holliday junction resolvase RusA-like endonuclease